MAQIEHRKIGTVKFESRDTRNRHEYYWDTRLNFREWLPNIRLQNLEGRKSISSVGPV